MSLSGPVSSHIGDAGLHVGSQRDRVHTQGQPDDGDLRRGVGARSTTLRHSAPQRLPVRCVNCVIIFKVSYVIYLICKSNSTYFGNNYCSYTLRFSFINEFNFFVFEKGTDYCLLFCLLSFFQSQRCFSFGARFSFLLYSRFDLPKKFFGCLLGGTWPIDGLHRPSILLISTPFGLGPQQTVEGFFLLLLLIFKSNVKQAFIDEQSIISSTFHRVKSMNPNE